MKNTIKIFGIIALVAVIGFSMAGYENGTTSGVGQVSNLLSSLPSASSLPAFGTGINDATLVEAEPMLEDLFSYNGIPYVLYSILVPASADAFIDAVGDKYTPQQLAQLLATQSGSISVNLNTTIGGVAITGSSSVSGKFSGDDTSGSMSYSETTKRTFKINALTQIPNTNYKIAGTITIEFNESGNGKWTADSYSGSDSGTTKAGVALTIVNTNTNRGFKVRYSDARATSDSDQSRSLTGVSGSSYNYSDFEIYNGANTRLGVLSHDLSDNYYIDRLSNYGWYFSALEALDNM